MKTGIARSQKSRDAQVASGQIGLMVEAAEKLTGARSALLTLSRFKLARADYDIDPCSGARGVARLRLQALDLLYQAERRAEQAGQAEAWADKLADVREVLG